jgi:tetrahydromethanopterin S-methyltransferase subunit G
MAVDERSRHDLHSALERTLGRDPAATLMAMLPATGWGDVASRLDLEAVGSRVEAVERHLTTRMDAFERRVDKRIEDLERRVGERMDDLERRVGERMAELEGRVDQRIEDLERRVGERMDDLERRVGERMAELEGRVGERMAELEGRVGERIEDLERRIGERMDDKLAALEHRIVATMEARLREQTRTMVFALIGALIALSALAISAAGFAG